MTNAGCVYSLRLFSEDDRQAMMEITFGFAHTRKLLTIPMLIHSFAEDVEDESVLTRVRHPIRRTSLIIA